MMKEHLPIYWYSGLYLQPQHFQSTDLYQSWQHAQHWRLGKPWQYGVVSATLNPHSLLDCTAEFLTLDVLTPDGEYLSFPGNCHLQKRSFRDAWKLRDRPFTLWGALRRLDTQQENVTLLADQDTPAHTRWVKLPEDGDMRDLYHRGPQVSVPRVAYNLRLLWDDERENALNDQCFPLLRVRMDGQDVVVDHAYAPPCIALDSVQALYRKVEQLYFELTNRARSLGELKHSHCRVNGQASNESFIVMMVMRSLNRALPVLRLYLSTPSTHPLQVYTLLAQLIGELSTFNDDCNHLGDWLDAPPSALAYDHCNLIECFDNARSVLVALLNSFVLEDNTYLVLQRDALGFYLGTLDRQAIAHAKKLYLMLRSQQFVGEETPLDGLSSAKLAERSAMDALIQHALPGVALHLCSQTPAGLPKRDDTRYLLIERSDRHWSLAEHSQALSFFWPHAPEDTQVQLIYAGCSHADR